MITKEKIVSWYSIHQYITLLKKYEIRYFKNEHELLKNLNHIIYYAIDIRRM
jgi:hypothetical protein